MRGWACRWRGSAGCPIGSGLDLGRGASGAVIDMAVRQQLSTEEIAEVLDVETSHAALLLSRGDLSGGGLVRGGLGDVAAGARRPLPKGCRCDCHFMSLALPLRVASHCHWPVALHRSS